MKRCTYSIATNSSFEDDKDLYFGFKVRVSIQNVDNHTLSHFDK